MKKLLMTLMSTSVVANASATVISCGGKDTIGIVLSTTANPYFSKMKDIATEYMKDMKYSPVFYDSNDDTSKELQNIENGITKGHKGMIVNPNNSETAQNADAVINANIPLITVDREFDGKKGAASFVTDNVLESGKLFDDIYNKIAPEVNGKVKVYVLRGVSGADASTKRFKGFFENNAAKIEGIGNTANNFANWERNTANDMVSQQIETVKNAQIIFAENDEMAMGAFQAMTTAAPSWFDNGYIIGFDGNTDTKESIAKWTETTRKNIYSTIEQDPELMIKSAIDKMIELIDAGTEAPKTYTDVSPVSGKLIKNSEAVSE